MLVVLHVRNLGVIEEAVLEFGPGMTALTGETGAGKTLVVEALALLLGGRADPSVVRAEADEAFVEGCFVENGDETVLARSVSPGSRSRAWIDGRMATAGALAEAGRRLVDIYGQQEHQSLLDQAAQRRALDVYGAVDLTPLVRARDDVATLRRALADLGGDEHERARRVDVLRYEVAEIDGAAITGPDEDDQLGSEEERLADAGALRAAAANALGAVSGEDPAGALELVGTALAELGSRVPLASLADRLRSHQAELADVATELREVLETWDDDPVRLAEVQARRQGLKDLQRKFGPTTADVLRYGDEARLRLEDLESIDSRAAALELELETSRHRLSEASAAVGAARRQAAPMLARAVEGRLHELAMDKAAVEIAVGADPGDDVVYMLAANPGEPFLPLAKVASGGELARTMLALRLEIEESPPTTVFDEVDAGVGGQAAVAVGRALAELAQLRQVLVVTHLPQVAAFAHRQVAVSKATRDGRTTAEVGELDAETRVQELARMLSGRPDSATARRHAAELLATAGVPGSTGRGRGPR